MLITSKRVQVGMRAHRSIYVRKSVLRWGKAVTSRMCSYTIILYTTGGILNGGERGNFKSPLEKSGLSEVDEVRSIREIAHSYAINLILSKKRETNMFALHQQENDCDVTLVPSEDDDDDFDVSCINHWASSSAETEIFVPSSSSAGLSDEIRSKQQDVMHELAQLFASKSCIAQKQRSPRISLDDLEMKGTDMSSAKLKVVVSSAIKSLERENGSKWVKNKLESHFGGHFVAVIGREFATCFDGNEYFLEAYAHFAVSSVQFLILQFM